MKILLTAPPRTGKSTVVEKFIQKFEGTKVGILAKEISNSENKRVGFKCVDLQGNEKTFMHIREIDSDVVIGNKYKVDVSVIDNFVVSAITQETEDDAVIIIDEIGRAQSFSSAFMEKVEDLLESERDLLCTIVYEDEVWARKFKTHPKVIVLEVTERNRNELPDILVAIYSNLFNYNQLSQDQKKFVINELMKNITNNELDRAKKLFKNAITYYVSRKYTQINERTYLVEGNSSKHEVLTDDNGNYQCDCDLFNGRGSFAGKASQCSHIDTIRVSKVA